MFGGIGKLSRFFNRKGCREGDFFAWEKGELSQILTRGECLVFEDDSLYAAVESRYNRSASNAYNRSYL